MGANLILNFLVYAMSAKFPCASKRPIVPGIIDLPKFNLIIMKIWKKLYRMNRVRLEITGNTSRYIHTHYAYAITFIIYSIQVSSLHDHKV